MFNNYRWFGKYLVYAHLQILHCFSRSRKNSLLYSFKFHWSYYILFLVWWCASFKWRKNAHSFFCIISVFKNLDNIVVQCHLLLWIFQFLNLTLMHYMGDFCKIPLSFVFWQKLDTNVDLMVTEWSQSNLLFSWSWEVVGDSGGFDSQPGYTSKKG